MSRTKKQALEMLHKFSMETLERNALIEHLEAENAALKQEHSLCKETIEGFKAQNDVYGEENAALKHNLCPPHFAFIHTSDESVSSCIICHRNKENEELIHENKHMRGELAWANAKILELKEVLRVYANDDSWRVVYNKPGEFNPELDMVVWNVPQSGAAGLAREVLGE